MIEILRLANLQKLCTVMASISILCLVPSACLKPVAPYQASNLQSAGDSLSRIFVAPIAERRGQILRAELERRFNTNNKKKNKTHKLQITMEVKKKERNFPRERIIGEVKVKTSFKLTKNKADEVVLEGIFSERSDYTVLSEFLARRDAEDEAIRHVIERIAGEIALRARLYFFAEATKKKNNNKADNKNEPSSNKNSSEK